MKSSFSAVIFDMDGVIFDSEKATLDIWLSLQEKYNIKNIEIPYRLCVGVTRDAGKKILLDFFGPDFKVDEFYRKFREIYERKYSRNHPPLKPGVPEILSFLESKKIKLALASSTFTSLVKAQLSSAGLLRYFDTVIGGDIIKTSKPSPEIYLKACEKLCVSPESAFAIEDSYNGIRSAYAGGLHPIMVPDMLPPTDEMKEKAVFIAENLIEAEDYLKSSFFTGSSV